MTADNRNNPSPDSPAAPPARPGLPSFEELLPELTEHLRSHRHLGLLFVDASPLARIEKVHGSETYDHLLDDLAGLFAGLRGTILREDDRLAVLSQGSEQFLVFLAENRSGNEPEREDLDSLADRVHLALTERSLPLATPLLGELPTLRVGSAFTLVNPLVRTERTLYRLVNQAREMAEVHSARWRSRSRRQINEIILREDIRTVFQPIVHLNGMDMLGHEALSRGPKGTPFENPLMLFLLAEQTDLLSELDQLCRRRAILQARDLPPGSKLFINTLPATVNDPSFRGEALRQLLEEAGRQPEDLVLEVTERMAIRGIDRFKASLEEYRQLGFKIAIDDTGAGYANLDTILELRPDYIKVDITLIREIDTNPVKQALVQAIGVVARTLGAVVIAEGIERNEELEELKRLDIGFGQGYLIARPGEIVSA